MSTFKELWNTVGHSQDAFPFPETFQEHLLHNLDMIFYFFLAALIGIAFIAWEEWKWHREGLRMKAEFEEWERTFKLTEEGKKWYRS